MNYPHRPAQYSEDLKEIIYCARKKSPPDQFHSAPEFADALRAVASGETPHLTDPLLLRHWRRLQSRTDFQVLVRASR